MAALREAVSHDRLVTLTGPGGVGKTRLALQVTPGMPATFPDGVYLVELSSLRDPDLLASAVAAALGLAEQAAPVRVEALLPFLRGKRLLLILDTCEHLVDACAEFTHMFLRGADGPRVLVTSRQALDLPGEVVYPVMPLSVLDGDGDAVALFADRAAAALPGFTVTPQSKAKAVALCRGLEGIPLAIELAAVRLRAMRLDELLAGLGRPAPAAQVLAMTTVLAITTMLAARPAKSAIRRCGRRSNGATTSARPPSSCCGHGCRCSPGSSGWTRSSGSADTVSRTLR